MKTIIRSICILLIISIASCTSTVRINVMKPAAITIKPHIKKLALIDRSRPSDDVLNIIEGVVTGENAFQDKEGSKNTLDGVMRILSNSPRFETVRTGIELKGSKTGNTFSAALPWAKIKDICKQHNSDAVVALEVYDSDFIITDGKKEVKKKGKDGKEYMEKVIFAQGEANIRIGFRLYDPAKKTIEDQDIITHCKSWEAEGKNVKDAIAHLIERQNAVNNVSYLSGEIYGRKISPAWVTVSRMMYNKAKKSDQVEVGRRRADVNDWSGAIEAWKKALNSGDSKTSGKAAYNLAVGYEVMGDLDSAKEWAQKAYTDYSNKDGRDYVRVIENRMWEEQKLKKQLGE